MHMCSVGRAHIDNEREVEIKRKREMRRVEKARTKARKKARQEFSSCFEPSP